eukprot:4714620-Prymnesium_polylepis.1
MATRRRFEPSLKNDLQSLGKGGGSPWGPVGRAFSPWAGSCMCGVRLCSFAVERVIGTANQEESTTKDGGLRNEDAGG